MGGGAHGGGDKAAHDYKSESSHGEAAPESHEHGHHDDHESGGPNWKGDVVQCCGEGVNVSGDFKLCCKAMCCPCIYYGQNMRRALLLDGYLHMLVFIIGMDLFWLVGSIMRARCSDPTLPPPSPMRPVHRVAGTPAPPPSPPPLAAIARYNGCLDKANNATGWVFFVTVSFFIYAVYRRHQMRKKFGMPYGTWKIVAHDLYAWVCCTLCAVCQEARTLSYNNVIDGRWLGPQASLNGLDLASDMEKAQAYQAAKAEIASHASHASSLRLAAMLGGEQGAGADYGEEPAGEAGCEENDGLIHVNTEEDLP